MLVALVTRYSSSLTVWAKYSGEGMSREHRMATSDALLFLFETFFLATPDPENLKTTNIVKPSCPSLQVSSFARDNPA